MKTRFETFLAIPFFALGIAFGVNALLEFKREFWSHPGIPAALSVICLLVAFLLLRRKPPAL